MVGSVRGGGGSTGGCHRGGSSCGGGGGRPDGRLVRRAPGRSAVSWIIVGDLRPLILGTWKRKCL